MIKAKKGLLIALFAALMIFAFGATSVFAAPSPAGHSFSSLDAVDADYPGLKVIVEPTCTTDGVGEITCTEDLNGTPCGAVKTVWINKTGHVKGDKVRVTAEQVMDNLGWTQAAKDAWFAANPGAWCTGHTYVCENCGKYLRHYNNNTISNYINPNMGDNQSVWDKEAHVAPEGTPACQETITCAECGLADRVNPTATAHDMFTEVRKAHIIEDGAKYVSVTTNTCQACGKVEQGAPDASTYGSTAISHGATTRVEIPSESPCTVTPKYNDVCNDCGMVVSSGELPLAKHTYVTTDPFDGGDGLFYTQEECAICGAVKAGSKTPVGFVPAPGSTTYSYAELAPANCEQGSWIMVTETAADGSTFSYPMSDEAIESAIAGGYIVKIGDKYYDKAEQVEIPYTPKAKHKFGSPQKVAEATCTERGIEAKVCEKCGKVDHNTQSYTDKALGHEVSAVVVPATCGAAGYTYNVCTRCSEYLSQDGKTVVAAMEQFDKTKPVVALGTECQYAWKVLEEATPFVMGTRAKVCTVCGNELAATKESIPKTELPAPAVKAKKKKAIVTVKEVEGAVSYQILVNGQVKVAEAKVGKNVVKKLKGGKKAKFQVVAIDASGNEAVSKAKAVKIKK